MQACDTEPSVAPSAPVDEHAGHAPFEETTPQLREVLAPAEESARGMLEAEEALRLVRDRFARTADPVVRGDLAAEALGHVERQLELMQEQRRRLDSTEAKLWSRQSRLEGFLIHTRGAGWWRERRDAARPKTLARD